MNKIGITLIGLLIGIGTVFSVPREKEILLKVQVAEQPWADSRLEEKIVRNFSRHNSTTVVIINEDTEQIVEFPKNYFNIDSLVNYGKEIGGQYVVMVEVFSTRLERRKSFHLPLIFHKYQTYGIMEGELRILDIDRRKLVTTENFSIEKKGPRIFQATMDDEPADPDVHIDATKKALFFGELEDKLVSFLHKRSRAVIGLR